MRPLSLVALLLLTILSSSSIFNLGTVRAVSADDDPDGGGGGDDGGGGGGDDDDDEVEYEEVVEVIPDISGKVVSCSSGEVLGKYPEIKDFLRDGEATFYKDVVVRYVKGQNPVLVINRHGAHRETVDLTKHPTKEQLHQLMVDKGFKKKTQEEIDELVRLTKLWNEAELHVEKEMEQERKKKREERHKQREILGEELRKLAQVGGEEGKQKIKEKLREMTEKLTGKLVSPDEPEL